MINKVNFTGRDKMVEVIKASTIIDNPIVAPLKKEVSKANKLFIPKQINMAEVQEPHQDLNSLYFSPYTSIPHSLTNGTKSAKEGINLDINV